MIAFISRRKVLVKTMAIAVAFLFTFSTIVWGNPDIFQRGNTPSHTLQVQSVLNPILYKGLLPKTALETMLKRLSLKTDLRSFDLKLHPYLDTSQGKINLMLDFGDKRIDDKKNTITVPCYLERFGRAIKYEATIFLDSNERIELRNLSDEGDKKLTSATSSNETLEPEVKVPETPAPKKTDNNLQVNKDATGNASQKVKLISRVWLQVLKRNKVPMDGVIVEVAPGYESKIGDALTTLNFRGKIIIVEPDQKAALKLSTTYQSKMPLSTVEVVTKRLQDIEIGQDIPEHVDALLANHPFDDMVLAYAIDEKGTDSFFSREAKETETTSQKTKEMYDNLTDSSYIQSILATTGAWVDFINKLKPDYFIVSQYPSHTLIQKGLNRRQNSGFIVGERLKAFYQQHLKEQYEDRSFGYKGKSDWWIIARKPYVDLTGCKEQKPNAMHRLTEEIFVPQRAKFLDPSEYDVVYADNEYFESIGCGDDPHKQAQNFAIVIDNDSSEDSPDVEVYADMQRDFTDIGLDGNLGSGRAVYYGKNYNVMGVGKTTLCKSTKRSHSTGKMELLGALRRVVMSRWIGYFTGKTPDHPVVIARKQTGRFKWSDKPIPFALLVRVDDGSLDRPSHIEHSPDIEVDLDKTLDEYAKLDAQYFAYRIMLGAWSTGNYSLSGHAIDLESASFTKYRSPYITVSDKYIANMFGEEGRGFVNILSQLAKAKGIENIDIKTKFYQARQKHLALYFLSLLGVDADIAESFLTDNEDAVTALSTDFETLAKKISPKKAQLNLYDHLPENEDPALVDMSKLFRNLAHVYMSAEQREAKALEFLLREVALEHVRKGTIYDAAPGKDGTEKAADTFLRQNLVVTQDQLEDFLGQTKDFVLDLFSLLDSLKAQNCLPETEYWKQRLQLANQDFPTVGALNKKLKYWIEQYRVGEITPEIFSQEIEKICQLPNYPASNDFDLKDIPLFDYLGLNGRDFDSLTAKFRKVKYMPGETIVSQGDIADSLFILVQGTCDALVDGRTVGDISNRGSLIGEAIAFKDKNKRTATVIARTPTILLQITKDNLSQVIADHPDIKRILKNILKHRNEGIDQKILTLKIFEGVNPEQLRIFMAAKALPRHIPQNRKLIAQGESAQGVYVIMDGAVSLKQFKDDPRVDAISLTDQDLTRGLFGERSIIYDKGANCDVVATQDTNALFICAEDFKELLEQMPRLLANCQDCIKQYVKANSDRRDDINKIEAKLLAPQQANLVAGFKTQERKQSDTTDVLASDLTAIDINSEDITENYHTFTTKGNQNGQNPLVISFGSHAAKNKQLFSEGKAQPDVIFINFDYFHPTSEIENLFFQRMFFDPVLGGFSARYGKLNSELKALEGKEGYDDKLAEIEAFKNEISRKGFFVDVLAKGLVNGKPIVVVDSNEKKERVLKMVINFFIGRDKTFYLKGLKEAGYSPETADRLSDEFANNRSFHFPGGLFNRDGQAVSDSEEHVMRLISKIIDVKVLNENSPVTIIKGVDEAGAPVNRLSIASDREHYLLREGKNLFRIKRDITSIQRDPFIQYWDENQISVFRKTIDASKENKLLTMALGTADPTPFSTTQDYTNLMLAFNGRVILVDPSVQTLTNMENNGLLEYVSAIYITHVHADHFGGITNKIYSNLRKRATNEEVKPIKLIAAWPTYMSALDLLMAMTYTTRSQFQKMFELIPTQIEGDRERIVFDGDLSGLSMVMERTFGHPLPTYGFKAYAPNGCLSYIPDSIMPVANNPRHKSFTDFFSDADLLIAENGVPGVHITPDQLLEAFPEHVNLGTIYTVHSAGAQAAVGLQRANIFAPLTVVKKEEKADSLAKMDELLKSSQAIKGVHILNEDLRKHFVRVGQKASPASGEIIYVEGDDSTKNPYVYIVLTGFVDIATTGIAREAGQIIGEMAIVGKAVDEDKISPKDLKFLLEKDLVRKQKIKDENYYIWNVAEAEQLDNDVKKLFLQTKPVPRTKTLIARSDTTLLKIHFDELAKLLDKNIPISAVTDPNNELSASFRRFLTELVNQRTKAAKRAPLEGASNKSLLRAGNAYNNWILLHPEADWIAKKRQLKALYLCYLNGLNNPTLATALCNMAADIDTAESAKYEKLSSELSSGIKTFEGRRLKTKEEWLSDIRNVAPGVHFSNFFHEQGVFSMETYDGCRNKCVYCAETAKGATKPIRKFGDNETVIDLLTHPFFIPDVTPLSINCRSTDPFDPATKESALSILEMLDSLGLKNTVSIITKFPPNDKDLERLESIKNLTLHLSISYSNMPKEIEGIGGEKRERFLREKAAKSSLKIFLVWRPLIEGYNTTARHIRKVLTLAKQAQVDAIVATGISLPPLQRQYMQSKGYKIPHRMPENWKKYLPNSIKDRILRIYKELDIEIPLVHRTSCMLSLISGLPDYNGYYIDPVKNCWDTCPPSQKLICQVGRNLSTRQEVTSLLRRINREDISFHIDEKNRKLVLEGRVSRQEENFLRVHSSLSVETVSTEPVYEIQPNKQSGQDRNAKKNPPAGSPAVAFENLLKVPLGRTVNSGYLAREACAKKGQKILPSTVVSKDLKPLIALGLVERSGKKSNYQYSVNYKKYPQLARIGESAFKQNIKNLLSEYGYTIPNDKLDEAQRKIDQLGETSALTENFLRDLRAEGELSRNLAEALLSSALSEKELVLAFENTMGRCGRAYPVGIVEMLKRLKKKEKYAELLKNVTIVTSSSSKMHNKLQKHLGKKDVEVFLFASESKRASLKKLEGKTSVHATYVDDSKFTEGAYYPLLEVVTITLEKHIFSLESVLDNLKEMEISLKELNITSVSEGENGSLVFTLIPNAEPFDERDLIRKYAALRRALIAA